MFNKQRLKSILPGKFYLFIFYLAVVSESVSASPPAVGGSNADFEQLLRVIDERLELMKDVAAYKFSNNIEIENKPREAAVLERAIAAAEDNQLDPESVKQFFELQIRLAKNVQKGWFDSWSIQGAEPPRDIPDLDSELRPKLINLGDQIIENLPRALAELHNVHRSGLAQAQQLAMVDKNIDQRFISLAMKRQLLDALKAVRLQPPSNIDRLAQIRARGVLRVGTTGDYKPFSFIDSAGQLSGIDIDLASNLAASLGLELALVKTSWPTLMTDFAADHFDIAMSGITRTAARQQQAFFSEPYLMGGKTPIARCDTRHLLNSLDNIDHAEIRVIVNPGGTNEKYVRKHINHAQVIVHPDNTTIFEQIIKRHADVMITDAIEVKVQQAMHPELCGTMLSKGLNKGLNRELKGELSVSDKSGGLLTHAVKAYLLPRDKALKQAVDGWLSDVQRSGKLEATMAKYL